MPTMKPLPNPLDAALDVRAGKTKMADLPIPTQQAIRQLTKFGDGKLSAHAAKRRESRHHRAFLPDTHIRRAVLS